MAGERLSASVQSQLSAWLEEGRRELGEALYWIPSGGSSGLGTLGYLLAALELAHEVEAGLLPVIDRVYVAAGSGSTLAGLALGFAIATLPVEVVGVRVVPRSLVHERGVRHLIRQAVDLIEAGGVTLTGWEGRLRVRVLSGHLGEGYGYETARGREAQALAAHDDLLLDPIYTAKAMGALLEEAKQRSGRALFWGTLSTADLSPLLERSRSLGGLSALPQVYDELFRPVS